MAILDVKNIHKSFGNNEVLKGIDFSLEKGDVLSIIGSSTSVIIKFLFYSSEDNRKQAVKQQEEHARIE